MHTQYFCNALSVSKKMYAGYFYQVGLLAFFATVSGRMGSAIFAKYHKYIELSGQKECDLPDFPDYGQIFNVTFADNSTLAFESDVPHIPDDKQMVEFCRSGLWVSYDNFTFKTWHGDAYGQGLNIYFGLHTHPMSPTCDAPDEYYHTRQIRSARRIGYEDNSPSATFFSETNYGGERIVYRNGTEIPVLPYEVNAFVVLNVGVLFFEEENFEGASIYNPSAGCNYIGCGGEIVFSLCYNYDVPESAHPLPFIPKSARIVKLRK